jgi:hypothetical protein
MNTTKLLFKLSLIIWGRIMMKLSIGLGSRLFRISLSQTWITSPKSWSNHKSKLTFVWLIWLWCPKSSKGRKPCWRYLQIAMRSIYVWVIISTVRRITSGRLWGSWIILFWGNFMKPKRNVYWPNSMIFWASNWVNLQLPIRRLCLTLLLSAQSWCFSTRRININLHRMKITAKLTELRIIEWLWALRKYKNHWWIHWKIVEPIPNQQPIWPNLH